MVGRAELTDYASRDDQLYARRIISTIEWIETSRLSTKKSLSDQGVECLPGRSAPPGGVAPAELTNSIPTIRRPELTDYSRRLGFLVSICVPFYVTVHSDYSSTRAGRLL